ncbi:hypothetical protein [Streptomyces sp. NPDC001816]|uniref:hypothetical protein n=1 Tax=Streptomyces sp. NPDC001816 TaxID=3364612 RepID=UPI003684E7E2
MTAARKAAVTRGLWERRSANPPYASWGTSAGDNGEDNAAHTPWAWDDGDYGSDLQDGSIAPDPAYPISQYFANTAAPHDHRLLAGHDVFGQDTFDLVEPQVLEEHITHGRS